MPDARPLRLLFVYAHVADAACEASGTMAVHVDRGDEVHVVICSDGERHHAALFLDADEAPGRGDLPFLTADLDGIKALKRREARRAMAILGTREPRFLGWPDEDLTVGRDEVRQLADVLLDIRPDLVLTHLPHHAHGGDVDPHAAVGAGLLRAGVEGREGRWGTLSGVSYAEAFLRGGRTYRALPMPEGWDERGFVPNDLPGDQVIAVEVPLAVPEDAFRLPD